MFLYNDVYIRHCAAGPLGQAWRYNLQETNLPTEKTIQSCSHKCTTLELWNFSLWQSSGPGMTVQAVHKHSHTRQQDCAAGKRRQEQWQQHPQQVEQQHRDKSTTGWLVFTRHHQPAPIQDATTDIHRIVYGTFKVWSDRWFLEQFIQVLEGLCVPNPRQLEFMSCFDAYRRPLMVKTSVKLQRFW